jgi:hypothetical protein
VVRVHLDDLFRRKILGLYNLREFKLFRLELLELTACAPGKKRFGML